MTVRSRLLLTLAGIILMLVIPAAYGVTQIERLSELAARLENVHASDVLALGSLRASFAELDRTLRSYVATPDESFREGAHSQLTLARSHLTILGENYADAVRPTTRLVDSLEAATARLEEMVEIGRAEEATTYFQGVKTVLDSARASLNPITVALDERGQEALAEARRVSSSAARTTALAALIALVLTIGIALWTVDALSRPLRRLSEATGTVADGDFVTPENLPYERADEIGHLSRSFAAMTDRLAELDRLKAEFVSLASHELKTPINVIAGYAELLEEGLYGDLDIKQREVLGLVQEQARVLTRLVNQLLDLSRFEAGGLQVEPQPVELRPLLAEVERSFRALATQKQIEFEVVTESSMPERAAIDPDRIRHEVIGNLLSNAFKFTASGGRIDLRVWGDGQLHLEVSDTGVGIPEDQLEHIFEKYYQVGADAKAKGSGLGLAIAKQIVEAHAGTIEARSRVGEGTTFRINMPVDGPAA